MKRALLAILVCASVGRSADEAPKSPIMFSITYYMACATNWVSCTNTTSMAYYCTTQNVDCSRFEEFQSTNKPTVTFTDGLWRVRFDNKETVK